jgi:hypothetical protein
MADQLRSSKLSAALGLINGDPTAQRGHRVRANGGGTMKAFGLVIGTALALAGCATGSVWDKPGGTQQSFAVDKYNCMKRRLPPLVGLDQEMYAGCMEALGWRKR